MTDLRDNRASGARDVSLDVAAGILIIWMIVLHIFQRTGWADNEVNRILGEIFFFFMPWFFFKAGMFMKQRPRRQVVSQSYCRLLRPFLIFAAIGWLVSLPRGLAAGKSIVYLTAVPLWQAVSMGSVTANLPLWFLLTLFLVRFIANELLMRRINLWVAAAVALLLAFAMHFAAPFKPYYVANTMIGLAFYISGYLFNNQTLTGGGLAASLHTLRGCIIAGLAVAASIILMPSNVAMFHNLLTNGSYLLWVVMSVLACVAFNRLCSLSAFRLTGVQAIGRDSMNYYVSHWIIIEIMLIAVDFMLPPMSRPGVFFVVLGGCILLLPPTNILIKRLKLT